MNATKSAVNLPPFAPLLATHEELRQAIHILDRRKRWQKLSRHPLRTVVNRLAGPKMPACQPDFVAYCGWSNEVRTELKKVPGGFITSYSLQPDSAHWLYELVRSNDFQCIIECGCGISSVAIALGIGRRPIRFLSLEHDGQWLQLTKATLAALGLANRVELVQAPLSVVAFGGRDYQAHSAEKLGEARADLLLIDAPPTTTGRAGVLPRMSGNLKTDALVVLDDAAREGERDCVQKWTAETGITLRGYLPLGTGLAVLTAS